MSAYGKGEVGLDEMKEIKGGLRTPGGGKEVLVEYRYPKSCLYLLNRR